MSEEDEKKYKILRKYFKPREDEVIATGLTLEEAQGHCENPETCSKTCQTMEGIRRTEKYGPWMDCYYEE